jgi:hypothetical protein
MTTDWQGGILAADLLMNAGRQSLGDDNSICIALQLVRDLVAALISVWPSDKWTRSVR